MSDDDLDIQHCYVQHHHESAARANRQANKIALIVLGCLLCAFLGWVAR